MAQPVRQHARSSVRKLQLSQAAARLFTERGYHNVSMDDVASAVGLTGPALYRHFRKKYDILAQAISEQLAAVEAVAAAAVEADLDPEQRTAKFLSELADLVLEREEVLLWKRERNQLSDSEQEQFRLKLQHVLRLTVQALGLGDDQEAGGVAELRAWSVLGLYASVGTARKRMDDTAAKRILLAMADAVLQCELNGAITTSAPPAPSSVAHRADANASWRPRPACSTRRAITPSGSRRSPPNPTPRSPRSTNTSAGRPNCCRRC